jgi:hypothetical protein
MQLNCHLVPDELSCFRYPQIIQSQLDTMVIVFKSNNNVTRTGFKAHYQIVKGMNKYSKYIWNGLNIEQMLHRKKIYS